MAKVNAKGPYDLRPYTSKEIELMTQNVERINKELDEGFTKFGFYDEGVTARMTLDIALRYQEAGWNVYLEDREDDTLELCLSSPIHPPVRRANNG